DGGGVAGRLTLAGGELLVELAEPALHPLFQAVDRFAIGAAALRLDFLDVVEQRPQNPLFAADPADAQRLPAGAVENLPAGALELLGPGLQAGGFHRLRLAASGAHPTPPRARGCRPGPRSPASPAPRCRRNPAGRRRPGRPAPCGRAASRRP